LNLIAIIPARGGSKRIPRKNIKEFNGLPIIHYPIQAANKTGLFNEIMVSTNDSEIAEISLRLGADIPFLRSEYNSGDYSTTSDVIDEVLSVFGQTGIYFDYVCCIYPTAALIKSERIIQAFNLLIEKDFDSVVPVVAFSYPIQRALTIQEDKLKFLWPENKQVRSQDLMFTYHDCGQFYWINVARFKNKKEILTENTGTVILDETEVQDIDNYTDWQIAEAKSRIFK